MKDRRSSRLATSALGTYRTPRGVTVEVEYADLSAGGCRVEDERGGLRLGEYVLLTIAQAGPFKAEVAWRQGTRVGLQFVRPMPRHILAALCPDYSDEPVPQGPQGAAPEAPRSSTMRFL